MLDSVINLRFNRIFSKHCQAEYTHIFKTNTTYGWWGLVYKPLGIFISVKVPKVFSN
jgi:hypothetical protein